MSPSAGGSVRAIIAPAGYGKTTLLLQHAHRHEGSTVWVDLDAGDDDPVVLISKLVTSFDRIAPVDSSLHDAVAAPGPSIWHHLMPRLGVLLSTLPGWSIILDDIQEVSSVDALDVIAWLALHVPDGSQLAIAGRSARGLPLPRLHVGGQLRELGASQLAFTDGEALEMLSESQPDASPAWSAAINERCEGWPAGLRLAALAGPSGDASLAFSSLSGGLPLLTEYVQTEILPRLDAVEVDLLVRASVLHRLQPALCDAVLEREDSGTILQQLAERNVFITLTDSASRWYRCHDLVREALSWQLEIEDPALPVQLRHRAAAWHAENGMPEEAVRYEQASGDPRAALRMIGRFARSMFGQGRASTLMDWLDWVEAEGLIGSDPGVTLSGVISLALNGEEARYARWAHALDSMATEPSDGESEVTLEASRSLISSLSARQGPTRAVADALEARALIPTSSGWRRVASAALGLALLMDDQDDEAEPALVEATAPGDVLPSAPNAQAIGLGLRAMLAMQRGDLAAAKSLLAEADRVRGRSAIVEQGAQALQDALVALIAISDRDHVEARDRLLHAQKLRPLLTPAIPGLAALTRCLLARAYLELADAAGARTLLLEVGDILHRRPRLGRIEREVNQLRDRLGAMRGLVGASTLTSAELRLLPLMATHLTFSEIGQRLYISGNTVKTHAMSIYRKLDATSRSEAVANAVRAGILDPAAVVLVLRGMDQPAMSSVAGEGQAPNP